MDWTDTEDIYIYIYIYTVVLQKAAESSRTEQNMVHVILVSTFLLINYLVTDKQINIRIVTNNKSKCCMSKSVLVARSKRGLLGFYVVSMMAL